MRKISILAAAFAAVLTADGPTEAQTASCERAKAKHGAGNVQCSSDTETVRTDPAWDEVHDTIALIRKPTWAVLQGLEYDAFKALHLFPEWLESERALAGCRDLFRRHNTKWTELSACLYVHADLEQLIAAAARDEADN